MADSSSLCPSLTAELSSSIRGHVYPRGDPNFDEYSKIYNGNVTCPAKIVVCPLDAEDTSKVVKFCNRYSLSLSVKSGGFGIAGWAVKGDVILDLSQLADIDIEPPAPDGSYAPLSEKASSHSKGKQTILPRGFNPGKRRREEDAQLRNYDSASLSVSAFLQGPNATDSDQSRPTNRRRLDSETSPSLTPTSSGSSSSDMSTSPDVSVASTNITTPSPPESSSFRLSSNKTGSTGGDPFSYLNTPTNFPPAPPPHIVQTLNSSQPSASTSQWPPNGSGASVANSRLPPIPSLLHAAQAVPIHKHAFVSFGAGKRQKEVDIFTASHPLEGRTLTGAKMPIPYHMPSAAHPVGSSIMLLGGFGFLGRLYGLSIDNLVEVEMVLADGRIVIVNERDHPDLFWAVRGAGPIFGIATRYISKAYPIPLVFAGNLIYRFDKATTPSLIKHFRDCVKGAPRELYANVLLTAGPAGKDSLVAIQICYVGSRDQGQHFLSAISSWDGERSLLNEVNEKSFLHQQDSVAQVLRGKSGRQWFIRSALINSLPDDIINQTVMQFADSPVGCTWFFELAGGVIADFENTCFPKSQREASFTIAALHQWEMNVDDERCKSAAEEWIGNTLRPVRTGGAYPSFLCWQESPDTVKACFGDNWDRLCEMKRKYDPNNMFRHNFWPLDEKGEVVPPIDTL